MADEANEAVVGTEQVSDSQFDIREPVDTPPAETAEAASQVSDEGQDDAGGDAQDSATEVEADDFDPQALAMAAQVGFSPDEARAFGTPANLYKAMLAMNRASQSTAQPAQPAQQTANKPGVPRYEVALKDTEYDPELVKALKGLSDHYGAQVDQLVGHLGQVQQAMQAQDVAMREQRFDRQVELLGEASQPILGTGPSLDLDQQSPEFKNRVAVWQEMERLTAGYRATGQQPPREKELFTRAYMALFGQQVAAQASTQARTKIADSLEKRRSQTVGRPGKSGKAPLDPDTAAVAAVAALMKERGLE